MPTGAAVKTGEQAAADQTTESTDAIGSFLNAGAAGVRRHRRLRRRVHHLQRLLHDGRPAAPRVRDAPRAGRLAPPGPRRVSTRRSRWGCSPRLLGIVAGLGVATGVNRSSRPSGRHPAQRASCSRRGPSSSRSLVGVLVTLLSALIPAALRATRVPPMAALQEGAALPPHGSRGSAAVRGRRRSRSSVASSSPTASFGPGGTTQRLGSLALGALLVFIAMAMVAATSSARSPERWGGRCRSSRPSAVGWRATTASATRGAPPRRRPP